MKVEGNTIIIEPKDLEIKVKIKGMKGRTGVFIKQTKEGLEFLGGGAEMRMLLIKR